MMRAVLVASGTVVGLVSVLSYAPAEAPVATLGEPSTGSTPEPMDTTGPAPNSSRGTTATPTAAAPSTAAPTSSPGATAPRATPSPSASQPSASPSPRRSRTPSPAASTTKPKPKPKPTAKPTGTPAPTPTRSSTPTPTPTPTGPQDFVGSLKSHRYGPVQVGIRVEDGVITDVWAVAAPDGESQDWSDRAVPILRQETLAAQSAEIASVTGATLTSNSWRSSLQSALVKAGLA